MSIKKTIFMITVGLLLSAAAHARDFNEINFPDEILLQGASEKIKLNGVGMRTKFVFDIYIGALYLADAANTAEAVLAHKGPKRVQMHFVYDEVSAGKLVAAWNEGFEENLSSEQLETLAARIKTFNALFETAHKDDVIYLDYLPGTGTRVTIKDVEKGVIEGEDFNRALLNIWLGDEPADDDLKEAMLGLDD